MFSQVQVAAGRLSTRRGGWGSPTVHSHPAVAAAQCRLTPFASPPQYQYQKERTYHDTTENHNTVQALGWGAELPSSMGEAEPGQCVRLVLGFSSRISSLNPCPDCDALAVPGVPIGAAR